MVAEPVGHVMPERGGDARSEEAEVTDLLCPELLGRDAPPLLLTAAVVCVQRVDGRRWRKGIVHEADGEDRSLEGTVPRPVAEVGRSSAPPRPLERHTPRQVLSDAEETGGGINGHPCRQWHRQAPKRRVHVPLGPRPVTVVATLRANGD